MSQLTNTVSFEAIRSRQGKYDVYIGVARAGDLINIVKVDYYDPDLEPGDPGQGYQRPPERPRITKIGRFLIESGSDLLFPTAVLLAARTPVTYDRASGRIVVSTEQPLQIVDGQHRIEGLRYAIMEKSAIALRDFQVPFVIMEVGRDKIQEMTQFRVINGTAKSVRTDLVNMILASTHSGELRADVPESEQWKIVTGLVVDQLAKANDSPWRSLIGLPGEVRAEADVPAVIRATSFITSIKPVYKYLKDNMHLETCRTLEEEADAMYRIVRDFWMALKLLVPDAFAKPEDYVIQKTPGIFSLHRILMKILHDAYRGRREFSVDTFVDFLRDSTAMTNADYWDAQQGDASRYGSMKGFSELYELLLESMEEPRRGKLM